MKKGHRPGVLTLVDPNGPGTAYARVMTSESGRPGRGSRSTSSGRPTLRSVSESEKPVVPRRKKKRKDDPAYDLDAWLFSTRKIAVVVSLIVLIAIGISLYFRHESEISPESQAKKEVDQAEDFSKRAARSSFLDDHRRAYEEGLVSLERARIELAGKDWRTAKNLAIDAQVKLETVIQAIALPDGVFQEVDGTVELQRGGQGSFAPTRAKVALSSGDFVKTGKDSFAEIRTSDGQIESVRSETLFEFTKRLDPSTHRNQISLNMQVGRINLQTSKDSSTRIVTPNRTMIEQAPNTSSLITVAPNKTVELTVYDGAGARIQRPDGKTFAVGTREMVRQKTSGAFAPALRLPETPALVEPIDNAAISLKSTNLVKLAWMPVDGAKRYHLQITRNRWFRNPEKDIPDRKKTDAVIEIGTEGTYFWRVAAVSGDGTHGEFTAPRRFRFTTGFATASEPEGAAPAKAAPALSVDDTSPIGNVLILSGQTDPGAVVTVAGEPASVDGSGRWLITYTFKSIGINRITIKATSSGAESRVVKTFKYEEQ